MKTFLLTFLSYTLVYSIFFLIFKRFVKKESITATITIGVIIIGILSILYASKKDTMDYNYLSKRKVKIGRYTSDNEFILYPYGFAGRKCILANSSGDLAGITKEEFQTKFQALTKGKKTAVIFSNHFPPQEEIWPVVLQIDTLVVNEHLLTSSQSEPGILSDTIQKDSTVFLESLKVEDSEMDTSILQSDLREVPEKTENESLTEQSILAQIFDWKTRKELMPIWIYLIMGAFGATSFGMMFNKRPAGFTFFPIILFFLVKDYYIGISNDLPLWKPIILSVWILLTGGIGAKSNRQFLEKNPDFKK